MDRLVRKIELPLAKKRIEKAGLYIAGEKDLDRLTAVAADAYYGYPLHEWFSKGRYDPPVSKLIMETTLKTMIKDALIYADSEEINGFAVWLPFGFKGIETVPFLINGGIRLLLHSGIGVISRLIKYESFAMDMKKEITNNFDWYLYNISINRNAQGRGIASKLLRPMLDFCDDEQMVSYLETNSEKNVKIYEHYGFELKKSAQLPKSNVTHYAMLRDPAEIR